MKENEQKKQAIVGQANQYRDLLVGYAFGFVRNYADAEDVVQDVYIFVCDSWEKCESVNNIGGWLTRVTRFKCLEFLRKRKRLDRHIAGSLSPMEEMLSDLPDHFWNSQSLERFNALKENLYNCVSGLSKSSKQLVYKYYFQDYSCRDLAHEAKQSVAYQKVSLFRLRKNLRECMKERMSGGDKKSAIGFGENEEIEELLDAYCDGAEVDTDKIDNINKGLESLPDVRLFLFDYVMYYVELIRVAKEEAWGGEEIVDAVSDEDRDGECVDFKKEEVAGFDAVEPNVGNRYYGNFANCSFGRAVLGIAAMGVLVFGLWFFIFQRKANSFETAFVSAAHGDVWIRGGDVPLEKLLVDSRLSVGDILEVRDGGVEIAYSGEETTLRLSRSTVFEVLERGRQGEQKRFRLVSGTVEGSIGRQEPDQPLSIITDQMEMVVLGTRFKLESNSVMSRVEVFEGRIKVTTLDGLGEQIIHAPSFAKVKSGSSHIDVNNIIHSSGEVVLSEDALSKSRLYDANGDATAELLPVENMPFAESMQVRVHRKPVNNNAVRLVLAVDQAIAKNSVLALEFYARGVGDRGEIDVLFANGERSKDFKINRFFLIDTEWKKYRTLLSCFSACKEKKGLLNFNFIARNQAVEIGGVSMKDLGDQLLVGPESSFLFGAGNKAFSTVSESLLFYFPNLNGWHVVFNEHASVTDFFEMSVKGNGMVTPGDKMELLIPLSGSAGKVAEKVDRKLNIKVDILSSAGEVVANQSLEAVTVFPMRYLVRVPLDYSHTRMLSNWTLRLRMNSSDGEIFFASPLVFLDR